MAEMYDITGISYQASRQPEWFTKALFSGKIIEGNYVRILPNVKKSTYLNMLDLDGNVLQKSQNDCGWNPTAALKLSEQLATVTDYKIQLEDCIEKFESTWLVERMKAGANVDELPATLGEASLDIVGKSVNADIERMLFGGDATKENEFDGIVKVLSGATDTIKISGSTLTKANIINELEKVFTAIPEAVLQDAEDKVKIFVSYNSYRVLKMALANVDSQVIAAAFTVEGGVIRYLGIEVVPAVGITNNQMVASNTENLIMLTDLVSDFSQIELGTFPKPNENRLWVKGALKIGVAVAYPSETVLYA